jgi:glycerophosphoryl diester phosphodiesterase
MKTKPTLLIAIVTFCTALAGAAFAADTVGSGKYKLILHRGGVVEDKFPDNCAAALQAAAKRHVWMIEVDIRETKDGVPVMRHDEDFQRDYHDPRKVEDMTWREISQLRSTFANQTPLRFEELVGMAHDAGLRLMLDTKEHSERFCAVIESILAKYDMVALCYIIDTPESRRYFAGKAPVGASSDFLKKLVTENPKEKDRFYLFEHGPELDPEKMKWAQANGIRIVPSINMDHYKVRGPGGKMQTTREQMLAAAKADIDRLKAAGVTEFQIDSEFFDWF